MREGGREGERKEWRKEGSKEERSHRKGEGNDTAVIPSKVTGY